MGRAAAHSDDFARWRRRWREEVAARHGEAFADACIAEADADVARYGSKGAEDRRFLESTVPALVANCRKAGRG